MSVETDWRALRAEPSRSDSALGTLRLRTMSTGQGQPWSDERVIEAQGVFYDGVGAHRLFRGTEIEIVGLWPNRISIRRELFQRPRRTPPENSLPTSDLVSVALDARTSRALPPDGGCDSAALKRVDCCEVNRSSISILGSQRKNLNALKIFPKSERFLTCDTARPVGVPSLTSSRKSVCKPKEA